MPPGNVERCFLLQMLSKTSVDEVFMHHFDKMSSASGVSPQTLTWQLPLNSAGGLSSFRLPHCAPWKKSCGRLCCDGIVSTCCDSLSCYVCWCIQNQMEWSASGQLGHLAINTVDVTDAANVTWEYVTTALTLRLRTVRLVAVLDRR